MFSFSGWREATSCDNAAVNVWEEENNVRNNRHADSKPPFDNSDFEGKKKSWILKVT